MNKEELILLKNSLPTRPGIMGREKYFNAAVLIPLIFYKNEYYFLFEKRAQGIRQGGEVSFPGGKFEPKEDGNCLEAALRETEEEIGIKREKIDIIGRLDTFISPRGLIIESFIGELYIDSLDEFLIDKNEVDRIFTIPVSWFENNPPEKYQVIVEMKPYYKNKKGERIETLPIDKLGLPPIYNNPWPSMSYDVYVFKHHIDTIWGITARLIVEFISKFKKDYI